MGGGTPLTDQFLRIKLGGDHALFAAIGALLRERGAVDTEFITEHTSGYKAYAETEIDWDATLSATG